MGHWDRKDTGGAAVPPEVKTAVDKLMRDWETFKAKNDQELADLKKKGSADTITRDELRRINDALDKHKEDINALFKKANRPAFQVPAEQAAAETKANAEFARWQGGQDHTKAAADRRVYAAVYNAWERLGEQRLTDTEKKALSVGQADGGGFYVEPARSDRILTKVFETSDMRSICSSMQIGTTHVILPVDRDDQDVNEIGEQTTRTETSTWRVGEMEIRVHELNAQTRITNNMLDDSVINIEEWNDGKVAKRIARKENTWFVSGNGVKQARGFLTLPTATTADASRAFGTLQYLGTGVSGGFKTATTTVSPADDLLDLIYAFKSDYRKNLRWAMNRTVLGAVRKFKDQNGNYIAGPRLDKDRGIIDMVFEYPVSEFADMPVAAANALAIALGDWQAGYMIVDRQGLRQLRDPFTRKGSVIYDTTKRVGGDVLDSDAIKLLKLA